MQLTLENMESYMTLFGMNDRHMAVLEQELNVSITLRGQELKIDGAAEDVALAEQVIGGFNTSSASDLGVGVLLVRAGLSGAWLNVKINLGSLKDREKAAAYEAEARALLDEALPLADDLYRQIEQML